MINRDLDKPKVYKVTTSYSINKNYTIDAKELGWSGTMPGVIF